jgi:ribosomal protein S27AE
MAVFTANLDCPRPECGEVFQARWEDDSDTRADAAEAPVAVQECPECGHKFEAAYEGYMFNSEAG